MKNKYEILQLNFISYYKFSFKSKKLINKELNKIILIIWLLKKYKSILSIKFNGKKKYSKIHVLLKSPKCYKKGKLLLKYQFFKYNIKIIKNLKNLKNLSNLHNYFKYYIYMFKFLDSNYVLNNNIKLLTYTNIF